MAQGGWRRMKDGGGERRKRKWLVWDGVWGVGTELNEEARMHGGTGYQGRKERNRGRHMI